MEVKATKGAPPVNENELPLMERLKMRQAADKGQALPPMQSVLKDMNQNER